MCVCECISVLLFAAAGYERDQILNSLQRFVFYFFFSEYICIGTHIHIQLVFFFVRFQSSFSSLTLLDHVVLVSSASTTNTREIKNSFFVRAVRRARTASKMRRRTRSKNCQNETKNSILWIFCFVCLCFMIL